MHEINLNDDGKSESAVIVGASLSGLMTGIALAREGLQVTILEKFSGKPRTGSGLQVDGGAFNQTKTEKHLRKLASGGKKSIQLWSSIESRLRKDALTDPNIDLHYNVNVQTVDQDDTSAWVVTDDGKSFHGDILIGADGHRSLIRRHVSPHKPNATYAGYIVWVIDTIDEHDLPEEHRPTYNDTGVKMFNGPNGFLFGNILNSDDDSLDFGNLRIGCAWYDNSRSDLLHRLGCVEGTTVKHSLKGSEIPEVTLNELAELANEFWPEPWLSATLIALKRRQLTGIPIKEYVPDNLIKGRIAIVGDAAHVPAPITASGFNESLQDAATLGTCVKKGVRGDNAFKTLERYESRRLSKVRDMVESGQFFTQSFGR